VDVEAATVDRAGIQENERGVDHGPGVGERDIEGVRARADGREELGEPRQDARAPRRGKHADRQVGGAQGRLDDRGRRLPREIGQRPGLGEGQR